MPPRRTSQATTTNLRVRYLTKSGSLTTIGRASWFSLYAGRKKILGPEPFPFTRKAEKEEFLAELISSYQTEVPARRARENAERSRTRQSRAEFQVAYFDSTGRSVPIEKAMFFAVKYGRKLLIDAELFPYEEKFAKEWFIPELIEEYKYQKEKRGRWPTREEVLAPFADPILHERIVEKLFKEQIFRTVRRTKIVKGRRKKIVETVFSHLQDRAIFKTYSPYYSKEYILKYLELSKDSSWKSAYPGIVKRMHIKFDLTKPMRMYLHKKPGRQMKILYREFKPHADKFYNQFGKKILFALPRMFYKHKGQLRDGKRRVKTSGFGHPISEVTTKREWQSFVDTLFLTSSELSFVFGMERYMARSTGYKVDILGVNLEGYLLR